MGTIKSKYVANKNLTIISSTIWAFFTLICVLSIVFHSHPVYKLGYIYIIIFLFPFLLIAGLYGYLISMFSFIVCFLVSLIFNSEQAYSMAVFLIAMFGYSLFSQYFWFKSAVKSVLAVLITSTLTTIIAILCFPVVSRNDLSDPFWMVILGYFCGTFILVSTATLILAIFFNFGSD